MSAPDQPADFIALNGRRPGVLERLEPDFGEEHARDE